MTGYVLRRVLLVVPSLALVLVIVFSAMRLFPGDVVSLMVSDLSYAPDVEAMRAQLGLDGPLHIQFGRWVAQLVTGDLGISLWTKQPVIQEIASSIPVTLELGLLAFVLAIAVGVPIGVLAAVRQDTPLDYAMRSAAIMATAVPNFWLGILIIVFGSTWWGWSPPIPYVHFARDPATNLVQFLVPAAVLAVRPMGGIMRMTRAMMLEVLRQDYIRTAWAKGLREAGVVYRHALKNAMIPVLTVMGLQVPFLLGGSIIVESIFGIPGLGSATIRSVMLRDYPMVQTLTVMFALVTMATNIVVDLAYAYLDPRLRFR